MQNTAIIIYAIFAATVAATITTTCRTRHRILASLLMFWILGASVIYQPAFILHLKALGGNVTMDQLLLYLLTAHLLVLSAFRIRVDEPLLSLPFEKFFYVFLGWLACVLLYHFGRGELRGRELRGMIEGYLAVLVVYVNLKHFADVEMLRGLCRATIVVAVLSSLMAVLQFFGGSGFLLFGESIPAFGGHIRGNGLFNTEYLNSYTNATALLLTLLFVNSWKLRAALIPILLAGIIVSFHRMSWIVTGLLILLYLVYGKDIHGGRIAFILVICFVVVYLLVDLGAPIIRYLQGSELYQSRLGADTVTDRFKFYSMVWDLFGRNPIWGIGTKESNLYFYGMLSTGANLEWARGESGGIHNLYLELLFLYGAPLLVLFSVFLGSMLLTWRMLLRNHSGFYLVQFSFTLAYCILNVTNGFPLNSELGMLFAIILGAGAFFAGRAHILTPDDLIFSAS